MRRFHPVNFAEPLDRRTVLIGSAVVGAWLASRSTGRVQLPSGPEVSIANFGARSDSTTDDTRAILAAIDAVERSGGGTIVIPGPTLCGKIAIAGSNVRIRGRKGSLINGRLIIASGAENIQVADLQLLDNTGDRRSYLMDVSGRNCRFENIELIKDPSAGGYQMYMRQVSSGCQFTGLRLRGSNGIMVAGRDHLFDGFEFESADKIGRGDDAFAIKGLNDTTENIIIRNGIVRGHAAIVSIGSEVGASPRASGKSGAVRNVVVRNVAGDRCSRVAFIKPGALKANWHDGVVEGVELHNLSLTDSAGERFVSGIQIFAGRGAIVRDIQASGITIRARAKTQGVVHTAAVYINFVDKGAPSTIEDVSLAVDYEDPYSGAPHGDSTPGFPIDHIVRIQRLQDGGLLSRIILDVKGKGSSFGGICVGRGMDGAVDVRRARLMHVARNPPSSICGGGIWSASRLKLGDVQVDNVKLKKFAGPAFDGTAG